MKKGWINTQLLRGYPARLRYMATPIKIRVMLSYNLPCKQHRRMHKGANDPTRRPTNSVRMVKRLFEVAKGYRHVSTK